MACSSQGSNPSGVIARTVAWKRATSPSASARAGTPPSIAIIVTVFDRVRRSRPVIMRRATV